MIKEKTGAKTRSIELATAQRSAGHFSSATDLDEAYNLGYKACEYAINGITGVMSSLRRISDEPYKVEYETADVAEIADKVKNVPADWIDPQKAFVTEENGGLHIFGTIDQNFVSDDARVYISLMKSGSEQIYEAFPTAEEELLKAKGVKGCENGFSAYINTSSLDPGEYEIHIIGNKMKSVTLETLTVKGE